MSPLRILLCAALVAAQLGVANADCWYDASGNMYCTPRASSARPARRWVQNTRPARTYTRVYSRSYSQPVQSSGSSANYGAGSSGYSSTYTTAPVVTYTSEPAAAVAPAEKAAGSAGCDCGCAEELQDIKDRLKALEDAKWPFPSKQTSKAGPAFSFTKQEGPAFAFTKPEGVAVASR